MTLFKHTQFLANENAALDELFKAFETSRKRHLVSGDDEDLILSNEGVGLSAVSHSARMCWAHFLCEELAAHLAYKARDRTVNQAVFLFTLVDVQCARPSNEVNVDLRPIIRRLRKGLLDCNFIGVIEPGLYPYITTIGTNLDRSKCVSWHLHVLVWGVSREAARRLAAKLNRSGRYVPIAPEQAGVDQRQVRPTEFAPTLAYLLKRPTLAYRLALRRDSGALGELRYKQYGGPLRPGEHVTLYLQMRHLTLSDTWIAGGEGGTILGSVKRRCRLAVRRHERSKGPRYRNRQFFQCPK